MSEVFREDGGALAFQFNGEFGRIEPWGPHALRIRTAPGREVGEPHVSALLPPPAGTADVSLEEHRAAIRNGDLRAEVRIVHRQGADVPHEPVITFSHADTGAELLAETRPHFAGPGPRSFKALASSSFELEHTFRAYDGERLFGLGQPQHGRFDLKGVSTRLLQQNTHVVIPFVVSSRGYGLLWNNPAVGRADFATNLTRWTAQATAGLDYWIVAGDTPRDIVRAYADATGHAPDLPDWATGFWQSRLRYRTQEELLAVAREHHRRGLPLACIVIDFFNWTRQGEWAFNTEEWPDPKAMVEELAAMGVKTMVSVWPTVSASSRHYREMRERGLFLRGERGVPAMIPFPDKDPFGMGFFTYYDAFNPEARDFHWQQIRENYLSAGISSFWLDACEPEMRPAHPENVRTSRGNGAEMLSAYPLLHQARYHAGLEEENVADDAVLLCRSAWAGSQRHRVILWSGDVWSDWQSLRAQVAAGLHAGLSGMGWWTTDIGGFYDGHPGDPAFHELLVRWFEFGVFSPICRLHGVRVPADRPIATGDHEPAYGDDMMNIFTGTGGDNELWSYGDTVYGLLVNLLNLRERLRPYIASCMADYSETGDPVMRPLFYDFPSDPNCAEIGDSYLFGPDLLVAPVTTAGATARRVYLPAGAEWLNAFTGGPASGGTHRDAECPLGQPAVFLRDGHAPTLDATFFQAPNFVLPE